MVRKTLIAKRRNKKSAKKASTKKKARTAKKKPSKKVAKKSARKKAAKKKRRPKKEDELYDLMRGVVYDDPRLTFDEALHCVAVELCESSQRIQQRVPHMERVYHESREKTFWWDFFERMDALKQKIEEWKNDRSTDLATRDKRITQLQERFDDMEELAQPDPVDQVSVRLVCLKRWYSRATREQYKTWVRGRGPNLPLAEDEMPLPEQKSEPSNALKKLPTPSERDAKLALKACQKIRANGGRLSARNVSKESTVSRPKIKAMCLRDMLTDDIKREILSRCKS